MANVYKQPCDEGVIRAKPADAPCAQHQRKWVLAATILGSSLAFIDASSTNVALPALQASLGATVIEVQWVINAYTLMLAALILPGGALGDRLGRVRVFASGVAIFALASLWCGFAPTIGHLVAARTLQGLGGALLIPGSLALISASFPTDVRGRAIGLWSGFSALTGAAGPVLGGWLIDTLSWRWIFFANIPVALVILAIAATRLPESRDRQAHRLDWPGALLITASLTGITYGLLESPTRGFDDPAVLAALLLGACLLVPLIVVQARTQSADGAARPVPIANFRGREPPDTVSLRRTRRCAFLPAPEPRPDTGLLRDRGRGGAPALCTDPVRSVALGGWPGRPIRRAFAADRRPLDGGRRLCAVRLARGCPAAIG